LVTRGLNGARRGKNNIKPLHQTFPTTFNNPPKKSWEIKTRCNLRDTFIGEQRTKSVVADDDHHDRIGIASSSRLELANDLMSLCYGSMICPAWGEGSAAQRCRVHRTFGYMNVARPSVRSRCSSRRCWRGYDATVLWFNQRSHSMSWLSAAASCWMVVGSRIGKPVASATQLIDETHDLP